MRRLVPSDLPLHLWNFTIFSLIIWLGRKLTSQKEDGGLFLISTHPLTARPFNVLYHKWMHICESSNVVLDKSDNHAANCTEKRPWSLHSNTFQQTNLAPCTSLDGLLRVVKYGQRHWYDEPCLQSNDEGRHSNTSLLCEVSPSYFLPHECGIPSLESETACNILNKYSHVVISGDSLARHTAQGLMMILTQDLVLGSYPRATRKSADLMNKCQCDGQFSEHELCRHYNTERLMSSDPRDYGICTHLPATPVQLHHGLRFALKNKGNTFCSNDSRPILIVLNGGTHYRSNVQHTIAASIDLTHHQLQAIQESCEWPLSFRVIWTGLNTQSRSLDAAFPYQSRERAQEFNDIVDAYVASTHGMIPLNFWNMTRDAAVSDGFHYLSEVNLHKANIILHAADFLA